MTPKCRVRVCVVECDLEPVPRTSGEHVQREHFQAVAFLHEELAALHTTGSSAGLLRPPTPTESLASGDGRFLLFGVTIQWVGGLFP